MRSRNSTVLAIGMLAPCLAGCQAMAFPFLMWGAEPTKDVPAEYPYLPGKKIAIFVWAEPDTLFEFPRVRLELSEHVANAMIEGFKTAKRLDPVNFVPNRNIEDFQTREPDWDRRDPAELGRHFAADRVLMIELTQYTTREPESTHLYRGRIAANVRVYDPAYENALPAYKTTVEIAYPPESHGDWGVDDRGIRKAAMELFASEVSGKFYDRRVKVK
jgi:hypothetical protein